MDSSYYTIWFAFTILEAFGIAFIRNPEYKVIRSFLIFRLLSDFLKLAVMHKAQLHWDISWAAKEIELVWLALIAGHIVNPGRAWRLPAFTLAAWFFHHLWHHGWPFYASPEEMFALEQLSGFAILGTIIIGAFWLLRENRVALAGAVAILTSADMVYALSYQAGNYLPKVAACLWAVGLGILLTAVGGYPAPLRKLRAYAKSVGGESPDTNSDMCIRLPLTPRPRFWS